MIPALINRQTRKLRNATVTNREYVYRAAFEMVRHVIGYEVQKALAAVDWLKRDSAGGRKLGVVGSGEGGMIALYAAALDERIDSACVSGYFDDRTDVWSQPIDRNVFGLLEQFGDAELWRVRKPQGLTYYAIAKRAGIPNSNSLVTIS